MNAQATPLLKRTWRELRRRKVVRVAISYALIAWIVLQVAGVVFPPLHVPDWAMTWLVLAAILGFPIALLMAWWLERTPNGLVQDTRPVAARGIRWIFGISVAVFTVAALAWWITQVYGLNKREDATLANALGSDAVIRENSIAVMPFADMSASGDQQYFSDGLAEQLLDRLAGIDGLSVASRTSTFALRDSGRSAKELGAILNTAYLIEGSVRNANGRIRVTVQLINTRDGFHLWSETYERDNKDIFAVQDQITTAVTTELGKHISYVDKKSENTTAATSSTRDAVALALYMQGRAAWRLRTPAKLKQAIGFFEQAIARDKNFSQAYAGLSDSYILLADYGSITLEEALSKAEPAAIEAITLAPESGESWASLGLLRMTVGQYSGAETSLKEAIERDPRYEMAQIWLARTYGKIGQLRNQQSILAKAVALNPLDPVVANNAAEVAANTGNTIEAEQILQRLLAVSPRNDMSLRSMANLQFSNARLDKALNYANRAYQAEPEGAANAAVLAFMLQQLGRDDDKNRVLQGFRNSRIYDEFAQSSRIMLGDFSLTPAYKQFVDESIKTQNYDPALLSRFAPAALVLINTKKHYQAIELLQVPLADDEKLGSRTEELELITYYIIALRNNGRHADAKLWQERLNTLTKQWLAQGWGGSTRAYIEISVASINGDNDVAVKLLENAYGNGWFGVWQWGTDPRFKQLFNDDRMQKLQAKFDADRQKMRLLTSSLKIEVSKS
jgi:TolB-like protein/tetratricopeptide (TPR) repeat protein